MIRRPTLDRGLQRVRGKREPRTLTPTVRFSPAEMERLRFLARRKGLPVSTYVRAAALSDEAPVTGDPRTGRTRFSEPRTIRCQVRFHPEEYGRVERLAGTLTLPLARYLREASVGYELRSRSDGATIRRLTRIGNELNQLTRLAHVTRKIDPDDRLQPILGQINRTLDQLF